VAIVQFSAPSKLLILILWPQEPIEEREHKLLDKGNKEPLALRNLVLRCVRDGDVSLLWSG
jgi:hypothetical protein